jgi:hypothetical protein
MLSEMPLTSRVRKVCQAWGTKLAVVKMAATEPTQSMRFMVCGYVEALTCPASAFVKQIELIEGDINLSPLRPLMAEGKGGAV